MFTYVDYYTKYSFSRFANAGVYNSNLNWLLKIPNRKSAEEFNGMKGFMLNQNVLWGTSIFFLFS